MGDNWDKNDHAKYLKYLRNAQDIFPDFKLKWYQKLWIDIQCWWILHIRKIWR